MHLFLIIRAEKKTNCNTNFVLILCRCLAVFDCFSKIFFALSTHARTHTQIYLLFEMFVLFFLFCAFFLLLPNLILLRFILFLLLKFTCECRVFDSSCIFDVMFFFSSQKWYRTHDKDYIDDRKTINQSLTVFHRIFLALLSLSLFFFFSSLLSFWNLVCFVNTGPMNLCFFFFDFAFMTKIIIIQKKYIYISNTAK